MDIDESPDLQLVAVEMENPNKRQLDSKSYTELSIMCDNLLKIIAERKRNRKT